MNPMCFCSRLSDIASGSESAVAELHTLQYIDRGRPARGNPLLRTKYVVLSQSTSHQETPNASGWHIDDSTSAAYVYGCW